MADLRTLFESSRIIELVDWPRAEVPAALDRAGFLVVGHEPDGYKRYQVSAVALPPGGEGRTFPLEGGGFLLSHPISALPKGIDIVSTFRPPAEQPDIARDAVAAGARALWIEPGEGTSEAARQVASAAGLEFVDGESIGSAVERLGIVVPREQPS